MMITAKTKRVRERKDWEGEIDKGVKRLGLRSFLRVGPDLITSLPSLSYICKIKPSFNKMHLKTKCYWHSEQIAKHSCLLAGCFIRSHKDWLGKAAREEKRWAPPSHKVRSVTPYSLTTFIYRTIILSVVFLSFYYFDFSAFWLFWAHNCFLSPEQRKNEGKV